MVMVWEFGSEMTRMGFGGNFADPTFWGVLATVLLLFGCAMGLMYSFAVALISPPSANRALPVRITMLAVWLVTAVATLLWAHISGTGEIIHLWLWLAGGFWALVIVIGGCERDRWGLRVARTIPRHHLVRLAAFPLYSGSVGGIVFGWMMLLCTIGLAVAFNTFLEVSYWAGGPVKLQEPLQQVLALGLYAHGYTLLAVLLQRSILAKPIPREHTWALVLALCALACTVPPILMFLFSRDQFGYNEDIWMLPAPYVVFVQSYDTSMLYRGLIFSGAFALVMTVFAAPWAGGVIRQFRHRDQLWANPLETAEERLGEDVRVVRRTWHYVAAPHLLAGVYLLIAPFTTPGDRVMYRLIGAGALLVGIVLLAVARGLHRRSLLAWRVAWLLTLPFWPLFPVGTMLAVLLGHKLRRALPLFDPRISEPDPTGMSEDRTEAPAAPAPAAGAAPAVEANPHAPRGEP